MGDNSPQMGKELNTTFTYDLLLPPLTVTCVYLGAVTGELFPGSSACRSVSPQLPLAVGDRVKQVQQCSSSGPPASASPRRTRHSRDGEADEVRDGEAASRNPVQEAGLVQRRSCEHSSGGWRLEASIAGSWSEEAEQRSTGVVSWIGCPDTQTALHRGPGKVPTLMSTETRQLACKHRGPSVPCLSNTCCNSLSACPAEMLLQDKLPEQELTLFPLSLHVFLEQVGETIILQKNILL